MKSEPTLSIAPYFGGKSKMAHFIIQRLNYDDSDIFITPFGGMCRVLLNKPRHQVEYYNDYSYALNALIGILANPTQATELIHRIGNETEYSMECFNHHKAIFDNVEVDIEVQERGKLKNLLIENKVISAVSANTFVDYLIRDAMYENVNLPHSKCDIVLQALDMLKAKLSVQKEKTFRLKFEKLLSNCISLKRQKDEYGILERTADMGEWVSDMDLAIATYVVFQQSRDGMGQVWSSVKFKSDFEYKKRINHLFTCAERLEGVHTLQIDAIDYFRKWNTTDTDTGAIKSFNLMNGMMDNPKVMMYCDPSYISPESERKLLEGIDLGEESLSDAILKKYQGKKEPVNLGKIYAMSFGYEEQEHFLKCIQKAKCRIMVSNYNLALYDKYLTPDFGWRKEEFETTTTVGGKAENSRVEVIWYNY